MNNKELKGGIDNHTIVEGFFQEEYTPAPGRIKPPSMAGKTVARCKMMPKVTGSITWEDTGGNVCTCDLNGGVPYPFLIRKITAAAGGVIIIHDGEVDSNFE